jgi:hypothetical protein
MPNATARHRRTGMSSAATHRASVWDVPDVARFGFLRDITRDDERHRRHELLTAFVAFESELEQASFNTPEAETRARGLWTEVRDWLKKHPMDEFSYRRMKSIYG